ncbi:MAG: SLC13 family permease [Phycisphaerales bacterium]|nr:SLC13 family permease [Planctomycetota bacterium]MCH8508086.1 SLC13 family permease [Phycisphaerales bacterium]
MTIEIFIVLGVLVGLLFMLAATRIAPDALLVAALTVLLATPHPGEDGWRFGVMSVADGFSGFSNPGMLTVGVLFVVVAGLRETGGIDWIASRLLGRPRSERGALVRVMAPVCALSAFLNNTPVVAMMIPAVQDWGRKLDISPSRLLIPLSYAAILGGTCSLIGTSTNLVVAGLITAETGMSPMRMFDITWVGLPTALICGGFLLLVGPRLLPDRRASKAALADPKEYTLELLVPEGSPLAGKTVDQAGLRSLPGSFLIEIERSEEIIAPVGPQQILREGDRLLFAGVVDSIRELANTRGLALATDQVFKLDSPRFRRRLYEAVVAPSCSLTNATIKQAKFRNRFNGAVIAVARNGERVRGKIGDIRLQGGDLLLVEADAGFADRAGNARDFMLVRSLEHSTPRRHSRAPLAVAILIGMVGLVTFELYPMLLAALIAAGAMVLSRCCTLTEARQSVDWSVLIVIGAALGIGNAMDKTGAAVLIADSVLDLVGSNPWMVLLAIYAVTSVLTAVISNNAAVALMFSITYATARSLGVDPMPFMITIMMAGSASFATPIGYQTNLMVYGPGGYTFTDFLRVGIPMNLMAGACTVLITPLVFPF